MSGVAGRFGAGQNLHGGGGGESGALGDRALRKQGEAPQVTRWTMVGVTLGIALLSALPLLVAAHVPLIDYPFHIARLHILTEYANDPFLQSVYTVQLRPIPNIAMDAVVLGLATILPVELAGRLFLVMGFVLTLSGLAVLHFALHRTLSPWPAILGAILLHNWIFLYGFINYLFGLALLPWALAGWILLEGRPVWLRVLWGAVAALTLFFSHLVAFALFAVTLGGHGLAASWKGRSFDRRILARHAALACAACVLPAMIYLFFSPTTEDAAGGFVFQTLPQKIKAVVLTPSSANLGADLVVLAALTGLAGYVWWRGKISLGKTALMIVALGALVFFAAPVGSKAGWHLDNRIPIALLLLTVAAIKLHLPAGWLTGAATATVCAAILVRVGLIAGDWAEWDRGFHRAREAFQSLPARSVLLVASAPEAAEISSHRYSLIRPPRRHLAAYAAFQPGVFVPQVYAHPQLQPISVREGFREIAALQREFDPVEVRNREERSDFLAQIRSVTDASPKFEHAFLLTLGSETARARVATGEHAVVSTPEFDIVQIR